MDCFVSKAAEAKYANYKGQVCKLQGRNSQSNADHKHYEGNNGKSSTTM